MKELKLENLMPAKDGLITSERSLALKMSQEQEKQLLLTKRQKISSQKHKVIEGKGYLPEQVFLMQTEVPYSGKKKCHKEHGLVRKKSEHQDLRQDKIA